MAAVVFNLPDDLELRVRAHADRLPEILTLGLQKIGAESAFEDELLKILEFLATQPPSQQIMDLRASDALQARIGWLLNKNRESGLSTAEEDEFDRYEHVQHLVTLAKSKAYGELNGRAHSA